MFRYVWNGLCRTVRSRPQVAAGQTSHSEDDEQSSLLEEVIFDDKYLPVAVAGNHRQFRNDLLASTETSSSFVRQHRFLSTSSLSSLSRSVDLPRYTNELPSVDLNHLLTKDEIESLIRGGSPNKKVGKLKVKDKQYNKLRVGKVVDKLPIKESISVEPQVLEEILNKKEIKNKQQNENKLKRVDTFQALLSSAPVANFASTAQHCVAESHHICGNQSMKEGKEEEAFRNFLLGSLQGCSKSQFNVALCYHFGTGTRKSLKLATSYYKLSAEQGHPHAQYNLSLILLGEDSSSVWKMTQILQLLQSSADQGFVKSKCLLGTLLIGCEEGAGYYDPVKAVKLFQQSCEKLPLSKHFLATCYQHGLGGLNMDIVKSFQLYTEASDAGCIESQYKVALMLWDGCKGIQQNQKLARHLMQQTATKGSLKAKQKLREINSM